MSYSNSSLNTFTNCMQKYEQIYILHNKPDKISPHLTFGSMAHEVLYNAGRLRDEASDGVISPGEYFKVIPSEVECLELKSEFNINSWENYFCNVIRTVAGYERDIVTNESKNGDVTIERELKLQLTSEQLKEQGILSDEPLVGVIDLLVMTKTSATILDYKFSTTRKTQSDFDENSQLYIYAYLVHTLYDIPLHNIQVGYIDIPKQSFEMPAVLKNGTLSRSKSQNCSGEMYKIAVEAVHEDDPYYNCEPGGYYYETYCELQLNKPAYLQTQYLDIEAYMNIMSDVVNTIKTIEFIKQNNMQYLRKYDSYSCKACEYKKYCKPWLTEVW